MTMAHYNLVFQGKIVEGASLNKVKLNIARLFKITATKVESLFSGKPIVIKKNLDTESAKKYLLILKKSGAIVRAIKIPDSKAKTNKVQKTKANNNKNSLTKKKIIPPQVKSSSPSLVKPVASSPTPKKVKKEVKKEVKKSTLQLSSVGTDNITSTKTQKATNIPDVDHLTMSEAQSGSLEEFAAIVEAIELPDIDNLSMSEANTGSMEEFTIPITPAELPDIAYINLSKQDDTPLSSESPKQANVAIPDISDLSMSDAQEGTLEGLQEKPRASKLPDISHLKVSEDKPEKPATTNPSQAVFQIN